MGHGGLLDGFDVFVSAGIVSYYGATIFVWHEHKEGIGSF